jgi:spore germination cell wall hydrolase CwlJ-like protein
MAFDNQIAALTIFCEASSATQDERKAVAATIVNRLHDGRFGTTIAGVCLKRFQFSEWNGDAANNANLERGANTPDSDPVMQQCVAAITGALSGAPDPTHGATHYHDKSIPRPGWASAATVAMETPKFIFYKNVP